MIKDLEKTKKITRKITRKINRLLFLIIVLTGIHLCVSQFAHASESILENSVGYSSNPGKEEQATGSGFTRHSLAFIREFAPSEGVHLTISPSAVYQNLWETEDNYRIGVETSVTSSTLSKRVLPGLFAGADFYRDGLIETDERNEYRIGVRADWLVSKRYTLSLEHSWVLSNYLSDAALFAHGSRNRGNNSNDPGQGGGRRIYPAKDDVGITADITLEMFLFPSLTASAGMGFERVRSSVDMESYWQLTPRATLLWNPARSWQVILQMKAEHRNYFDVDERHPNIREINDAGSMEIKVSRVLGKWEVFADLFIEHGEWPLHSESYLQREAQCGLSWSF